MTRPSKDTKWSLSATKTEPSSGQKDAGWVPGQKPPAQWENWFKDAYDVWIKFFNGAGSGSGGAWIAGEAPSLGADPANGLLYSSRDGQSLNAGGGTILRWRIYNFFGGVGSELWITNNAVWNGTTWVPDSVGYVCIALKMSVQGVSSLGTAAPPFELLTDAGHSPIVWKRSATTSTDRTSLLGVEDENFFFTLGYVNSWADGSTGGGASYRIDPTGRVYLAGVLTLGTNNSAIAAALPVPYRPSQNRFFSVPVFDESLLTLVTTSFLHVTAAGLVIPQTAAAAGHGISLDGLSYMVNE